MGRSTTRLRFRVAHLCLEVAVEHAPDAAPLLGAYERYSVANSRAPDARIELVRIRGFTEGRTPSPTHPSFMCRPIAGDRLALSRWDAEGVVELAGDRVPPLARFRASDNPNAAEAVIRAVASLCLPRRDTLLLHASAVRATHGAVVFLGTSGAGKSTIAQILTTAPCSCGLLADELLAVARTSAGWRAYSTPFVARAAPEEACDAVVDSVHLLVQADAHARVRVSHGAALRGITSCALAYVNDVGTARAVLDLTTQLALEIPAYELRFARDSNVCRVLGITC